MVLTKGVVVEMPDDAHEFQCNTMKNISACQNKDGDPREIHNGAEKKRHHDDGERWQASRPLDVFETIVAHSARHQNA